MNLTLRRRKPELERDQAGLSFNSWAQIMSSFSFMGLNYSLPGSYQEEIGVSYTGLARGAFKGNGVVFACIDNRIKLFSEARFLYRRQRGSRPGDLFGFRDDDLGILRTPWVGGTTGDLLARMLLSVDIGGNSYTVRRPDRLTPLRPDWVSIISGVRGVEDATVWHPDAEVLGYEYTEGGPGSGKKPVFFMAEEVAHFAPIPDPEARFRGMSWITPIVREVMGDNAASDHKLKFFENGATPNMVVKLDADNLEKYQAMIDKFKGSHDGAENAYRTMFITAGSDVSIVGADLKQLDFKITQGAGETRIAAAAGVPPVVVGLSEGLAAATYSNYAQARRRFADNTMRPLWRNAAGSLARIIQVPSDAELWYDDRDISALQEDQKDAADIQSTQAQTIKALIDAGYESDTVVKAVTGADFTLLQHTGLFSVQLQPPGTVSPPALPASNGAGTPVPVPQKANGGRTDPEILGLLLELARQRTEPPVHLHLDLPDITVEPARIEAGAVQVTMPPLELPPAPDVHVTVEPTRFEEGAIQVAAPDVHMPEITVGSPDVNVTFETPKPADKRRQRVTLSDGQEATVVTDGDTRRVEFDDGRVATLEAE